MRKVERLRENLKWHGRTGWLNTADITEALDEQDAEIARLRSLLKPMADMADHYDSLGYEDRTFVACVNNHGEYIGIKIGDLYAARREVRGE